MVCKCCTETILYKSILKITMALVCLMTKYANIASWYDKRQNVNEHMARYGNGMYNKIC